jgi:galactofuranosylgalactofuranosylrhamnosyl-N-acetylglucosaminyl-diphospho-decaprenol beta-1,5/1,6-galactofuranosyltransferase
LDSAVVSTADGTAASWYRRDRKRFAQLSQRSIELHRRLLAEWPELSRSYQQASGDLTSPQTWATSFAEIEAARQASAEQPS